MGVHGLWKLLEPSGQMVPLESLAGKVLAVDVSIWLHQAIKGMHDTHGAPVTAAHLLILFHRLCKLLFYKIKPVFVFDGGVPALKHSTMAARRQQSNASRNEAIKVREKLIRNLLKHEAVRQVLSNETASAALGLNSFALPGPSVEEDLYKLPPIAADCNDSESSEEAPSIFEEEEEEEQKIVRNIHSVDVTSNEFLNLPPEIRHEILTDLIETRKQNSWKHLDLMPKESDSFSDFQMNRLLKRHAVQSSLEKAGKEMGGRALSLKELEALLGDQGVLDSKVPIPGKRIAQDNVTRYMLIQKDSNEKLGDAVFRKKQSHDDLEMLTVKDDLSSESDTDILLRQPSKIKKENNNSLERSDKVETELCSISKKPKVRMTKEIVDILTILDDSEAETDVKTKVEDLRNKLYFEDFSKSGFEISVKKELLSDVEKEENPGEAIYYELENHIEEKNTAEKETIFFETKENESTLNIDFSEIKASNQVETSMEIKSFINDPSVVENVIESGSLEVTKYVRLPEEKCRAERIDDQKKSLEEVNTDTKSIQSSNSIVVKCEQKDTSEKNEELSSSDSESDFICVEEEDEKINKESTVILASAPKVMENNETFTVTINPSQIGDNDDMFADVFEKNKSIEKTEENLKNSEDQTVVQPLELENSMLNEYKSEFVNEISSGDLTAYQKALEEQQFDLLLEQGKQDRHALNPTDQMYSDAQELLRLFGVPYIVAPMEAEAQCAVLNTLGLTEGTITDDSDIWLFGGLVVYKNFFNQNKHVLEYKSENIHKYFKLTREDLIKIAMMVGSDYTLGLNGIGPVTAVEILASFPSSSQNLFESLEKFRDWFTGKAKNVPPRTALKKKIRNTIISPGFPNRAVGEAYLNPQVDDSKEPFSWAKPNVDLIRKYVRTKMGWSSEKCNDLLLPVLKKMEDTTSQRTMERYFSSIPKASMNLGLLSKRVENAIKRLGGDEDLESEPKPKRKRKSNKRKQPGEETLDNESQPLTMEKQREKTIRNTQTIGETSKIKYINEKLHKVDKIPQKEKALKLLEERKKQAIEIFRTYKKKGKKTKVFAKKDANLSESSSEDEGKTG